MADYGLRPNPPYALLDYAEDAAALGRFEYEAEATLLLACTTLAFIAIRLHLEGR